MPPNSINSDDMNANSENTEAMRAQQNNKDRLTNLIAAQYVLGTLSTSARQRFQQLMQQQPELLKLTHAWERHFSPLAQLLEPQAVPDGVWARIENALDQIQTIDSNVKLSSSFNAANDQDIGIANTDTTASMKNSTSSTATHLKSYTFWKPMAWLSSAVAAGLALFIVVNLPHLQDNAVPVVAQAQPIAIKDVAVLSDNEQQPAWIVRLQGRTLSLHQLNSYNVPEQHDLELWSIGSDSAAVPKSLGVVRLNNGKAELDGIQTSLLTRSSALALSLEPKNGSPTGLPTGTVLYSGKVV